MHARHPHVELAHRVWDATARGDVDDLLRIYAPDVVLRVRGRNPLALEYKGVAAVLEYFARTAELVDELRSDLVEVYGGENGALMRYRLQASHGDDHLDVEIHLSLRVTDGRICELETVSADQARSDAFWTRVAG